MALSIEIFILLILLGLSGFFSGAEVALISLTKYKVKHMVEQKKAGIYGTVSELGEVNSKYSLALEIAAGHRLKSIVVENEKIASEQIKYLKQNKLGIATFIPLNKINSKFIYKYICRPTKGNIK